MFCKESHDMICDPKHDMRFIGFNSQYDSRSDNHDMNS